MAIVRSDELRRNVTGPLERAPTRIRPSGRVDVVTGQRVERRGAHRDAGAQIEAGVVPRAADGVADDQPFGERAAVVRAGGAERHDLVVRPADEQHGLAARVPEQRRVGGEVAGRDPRFEVRPRELRFMSTHVG